MDDEIFVWIVLVVVIAVGFNCFHLPANGGHTGYVTAVEKSGYIFDTWTAYIKTDTQSSQEDKYCVTDQSLVAELQSVQETNAKVTLEYQNGFFIPPWQCKGSDQSIITKIK